MGAEDKKRKGAPVREEALEQGSGTQAKEAIPDRVQLFVAEFRRRSAGLQGEELEKEISRLMDRIIERHLSVAPEGVRADLRETLLTLLKNDPAFAVMLEELRSSPR
jgi:hypothetical protein